MLRRCLSMRHWLRFVTVTRPKFSQFSKTTLFPSSEGSELPCSFVLVAHKSCAICGHRADAQATGRRNRFICCRANDGRIVHDARELRSGCVPATLHASDVGADARLTVHSIWRNDGNFVASIMRSAFSET